MKSTPKILLALFLFFLEIGFTNLQAQKMNTEQALFYFMKVYDINPTKGTFTNKNMIDLCGSDFITYYAKVFDSFNYGLKKDDEFEKKQYFESVSSKIKTAIDNLKFESKYTKTWNAKIGEYMFSIQAFPINFEQFNNILPFYFDNNCRLEAYCEVINYNSFGFSLSIPEAQAKKFIEKRKDGNGQINRNVCLNLNYSVVNKKATSFNTSGIGSNIVIYVDSIDIYEDESLVNKLGTIHSYMNLAQALKVSEGKERINKQFVEPHKDTTYVVSKSGTIIHLFAGWSEHPKGRIRVDYPDGQTGFYDAPGAVPYNLGIQPEGNYKFYSVESRQTEVEITYPK